MWNPLKMMNIGTEEKIYNLLGCTLPSEASKRMFKMKTRDLVVPDPQQK